jgi:hypothetical protein
MGLYEEALVDAKKLKELAEADAKRAIVEELTPFIRQTIAKSVSSKNSFLFEEEEPEVAGAPIANDPSAPPVAVEPSVDASAMAAPITPTGAEVPPIQATGADTLNMPMPGADGKLVVDFDDMFVLSEPGDDSAVGMEGPASAELSPEVPGGIPSAEPVDVNPLLYSDQNVIDAYAVRMLPTSFLISPTGVIARRYVGPLDAKAVQNDILSLLKRRPS